jgi:serine protease
MARVLLLIFVLLGVASIAYDALHGSPFPAPTTAGAPEAPAAGEEALTVFPRARTPLGPLVFTCLALLPVLLTLPRRSRPGYSELTGDSAFAMPAMAASTGFGILMLIPARGLLRVVLNAFALPLPDWDQLFVGSARQANPFFYSAALVLLLAPFAVGVKALRRPVAGLAVGYAGVLGCAAWTGTPPLEWLPAAWLSGAWLVVNALVCLFLARAVLLRDMK